MMLAVLLLLALSNLTRGSLSDWLSDRLYWLFGWGAFFFVLLLGAIGVLIIARTQNIVHGHAVALHHRARNGVLRAVSRCCTRLPPTKIKTCGA